MKYYKSIIALTALQAASKVRQETVPNIGVQVVTLNSIVFVV